MVWVDFFKFFFTRAIRKSELPHFLSVLQSEVATPDLHHDEIVIDS